jgi:calcineurin-like phosphoesterase family protein
MCFTRKFYISDTHFSHENIIRYSKRPFTSIDEMNEFMIAEWNSTVKDHDIVYHLGDFACGSPEGAAEIFSRLRGRKILILGNHDVRRGGEPHKCIAALQWDRPPVTALEVNDGGNRVFLSHYAHRTWPGAGKGSCHFYGHSHGNIPNYGRSRDVGVDVPDVNFRPRTFSELTAALPEFQSAAKAA